MRSIHSLYKMLVSKDKPKDYLLLEMDETDSTNLHVRELAQTQGQTETRSVAPVVVLSTDYRIWQGVGKAPPHGKVNVERICYFLS